VRLTLWTREPNCKLLFFYYSNDYDFPVKSPRWDLIIFMCYYFPIFIWFKKSLFTDPSDIHLFPVDCIRSVKKLPRRWFLLRRQRPCTTPCRVSPNIRTSSTNKCSNMHLNPPTRCFRWCPRTIPIRRFHVTEARHLRAPTEGSPLRRRLPLDWPAFRWFPSLERKDRVIRPFWAPSAVVQRRKAVDRHWIRPLPATLRAFWLRSDLCSYRNRPVLRRSKGHLWVQLPVGFRSSFRLPLRPHRR